MLNKKNKQPNIINRAPSYNVRYKAGPINNCNVVLPPNIKIVNEVGIIEDSLWKSEITWAYLV